MPRIDTFTFKVFREEREMLDRLAERLQRSRSDTVRLLVREAASELDIRPDKNKKRTHELA